MLRTVTDASLHYSPKWANMILGLEHMKRGNYVDAKKYMQNVTNVDDFDSNAWECLGLCFANLQSTQTSIKAFKKALETNPDSFYSDYK